MSIPRQKYTHFRVRSISVLLMSTLVGQIFVASYVSAGTSLSDIIANISQPVSVLQSPTDLYWTIPKNDSTPVVPVVKQVTALVGVIPKTTTKVPVIKSVSKTPSKTTPPKVTSVKTLVTIKQTPLPINFDASGVLRIRKVGKTEIIEMLVKDKNGNFIGTPYYGLGNFVTFNSASSNPQNTTTNNNSSSSSSNTSGSHTTTSGLYPSTPVSAGFTPLFGGGTSITPVSSVGNINNQSGSIDYFTSLFGDIAQIFAQNILTSSITSGIATFGNIVFT